VLVAPPCILLSTPCCLMASQGDQMSVEQCLMSAGLDAGLSHGLSAGLAVGAVSESKALTSSTSGDTHLSALSTETGLSGEHSSADHSTTPEPLQTPIEAAESTENDESDPRNTDLNYFHAKARFQQAITEGQFTKLKGLAECCRSDGKVELHSWCRLAGSKGSTVVVKRVVTARVSANLGKEGNERIACRGLSQRHAEDALNEIGVYCYLAEQQDLPQYILRMHAVFQAGSDVWLVLEHANAGDLFAIVQKLRREGSGLSLSQLMTWTWQLLQAVRYLHKHYIAHRDISMENVLLSDGTVRLMDFGQSVQTHSTRGTPLRYFNALGKPYYRPPECYTPTHKMVDVHVPKGARSGELAFVQTVSGDCMCEVLLPPSAVPGQVASAEPWGYAVPPVDIFACGVCIFIMATGMPPWRQANLNDSHFAWVHQCGISQLLKAWKKPMPPAADELLASMVQSAPAQRPSVERCLLHTWLEPMNGVPVTIHPAAVAASLEQQVSASSSSAGPSTTAETVPSTRNAMGCVPHVGPSVPALACIGRSGDPYQRDATVRGVAGPLPEVTHGSAGLGGVLAGDFYAMPDQLWRSIDDSLPKELTLERFSTAHAPPTAQSNCSCYFEPSTFHTSHKEPAKLGNRLIDFLTMAAGAVVTKVNTKKFTIKAEVDGDAGACMLKVRIIDEADGRHAIEFQRRSGESTALHKVFDDALKYFADALSCPSRPSKEKETGDDAESVANTSNSHPRITGTLAPQLSHLILASPSRFREQAGSKVLRRILSMPPPSTRLHEVVSKSATSEHMIGPTVSASNPAGSGLNAIRWRSKLNSKLHISLRFNSTV